MILDLIIISNVYNSKKLHNFGLSLFKNTVNSSKDAVFLAFWISTVGLFQNTRIFTLPSAIYLTHQSNISHI